MVIFTLQVFSNPTWGRVYGRLGSELVIKIGDVVRAAEMWEEWRLGRPAEDVLPHHSTEEPVLLQGIGITFPEPETLLHLPIEQFLQYVLRVRGQIVLQLELPLEDPLGDDLPVVAGEGGSPGQHVVDQDAEAPPVDLLAVPADSCEQ